MTNSNHDQNKQIVRDLFEKGFNGGHSEVLDRLVADDFAGAAGDRGPRAFQQVMTRLRGAFPDLHYTLDDLLAEGDKVAVRWHWTGTHRGPFRTVPPTGRAVTNEGSAIFELRGGKIVAAALGTDRLGFLQSIGVVPSDDGLFPPRLPEAG